MNNMPFIKVFDEETKDKLIYEGLTLISESNGVWTFVNESTRVKFSNDDKLVFSNKLEL